MKILRYMGALLILIELAIPVLFFRLDQYPEKAVVVIIPSYKNERWVEKNLTSVLTQKYTNYRIIYIDDCSPDLTYQKTQQLIKLYGQEQRTTVIHNSKRIGAMENLYNAINSCKDDEIVVLVDGDDWLAHDKVLAYINCIYANKDIWLTYGQFQEYPSMRFGYLYSMQFPSHVVKSNTFRLYRGLPMSHLRTFYAWLFKAIDRNDLMHEGQFYTMSWDKAFLAPMAEMAADHMMCIYEILYIYNNSNPLNDHRVNVTLQHALADEIYHKTPYKTLNKPLTRTVCA